MERGYHHGDLRAALLTKAEERLRISGTASLSLRELARDLGVSHGAPRRHFNDKAALMESLAVEGFRRLGQALEAAAHTDDRDFTSTLHDVAIAFVRFSTDNPALVGLMSTYRQGDVSEDLRHARASTFRPVAALIDVGRSSGELVGDAQTIGTAFFAILQGLLVMANNRTVDSLEDHLILDVVDSLLYGLAPHR